MHNRFYYICIFPTAQSQTKKWKELPSQRSTERLKRATTDNNQSFVLARRTWDETPVERKLRELFQRYGFTVKFLEDISRDFYKGLFFVGEIGGFPSRLGIISLTQNLFFMRWLASAHLQKPTWWTSQIKGRNAHQIANYTTTVFWWNALGGSFSLGWMPNFCCKVLSFLRFQVLLKKP